MRCGFDPRLDPAAHRLQVLEVQVPAEWCAPAGAAGYPRAQDDPCCYAQSPSCKHMQALAAACCFLLRCEWAKRCHRLACCSAQEQAPAMGRHAYALGRPHNPPARLSAHDKPPS